MKRDLLEDVASKEATGDGVTAGHLKPFAQILFRAAIPFLLFCFAFQVGASYYQQKWRVWGGANFYPSDLFAPAVMQVCGRGFTNPLEGSAPKLESFLRQEAESFSCGDVASVPTKGSINGYQYEHFFFVNLYSFAWRLMGVSWSAIAPLFGLFLGSFVALCYALFRLTLGRVASGFFAFAFLSSPYVLTHLPGLRDYSRGIFSLLSVWFLFFLVLKTEISERRKCISVTVLAAIALGFASRIRPDLVVCLPIVLMGIAFLGKTAVEKVYLKFKLSLLGLFFLLFALISYGIPYKWRDYTPHIWANQLTVNILHGQMGNQTADLGIAEPPYELGHWAIDQEISLLMMSYNERVRNEPEILEQYDVTAGKRLFASVLEDYPADFLFRFVASIRSMVNLPITVPDWWQTPTGGDSLLLRGTDMRLNLNRRLLQEFPAISQFSILLFAVALVAIVLWTPLPGVVIAFSVLYFFAIPALRFQPRHYFFYEVLGWWVWATALKGLLIGGLALARKRPSIEELKRFRPSKKAAAVVGTGLAVGLLYLGTLTVLRKIQDSRLKGRISEILSSERVQVTPVLRAQSSGQNAGQTLVLLSGNAAAEPLGLGKIRTHYFGVKFSREMCSQSVVDFDVVYDKPSSVAPGFGRHVRINLKRAGSDVLYLFPTYDLTYQDGVLFQGIRLDSADAACFKEAFRLARTPKDPFLMNIKLTDDWRATDFYQSYLVQ